MSSTIAGTNGHDRSTLIELQRLLLPPTLPPIGCTEAAAHYRVHNDEFRLGGDWYDLIDRPDNRVVAIVGDVVGHGVQQISVMGQLRAASNALGRTLDDPAAMLTALDAFALGVPGAEYASVAILMLDGTTTGRLALAGHPAPLHVRPHGGWSTLDQRRGPLLGVAGTRETATFEYAIDDVVLLYTDGLIDRRDTDPDDITAQVGRHVSQRTDKPCQTIATGVVDEFGGDADDDVVVMALRPRNHRSAEYVLEPQLTPSSTFD